MNSEEVQLVRNAQNGDREALGVLWDQATPKLFGYLVNVTRDKTLSEDLLQNTWLKAITALPRFQARGVAFSAWLFAIARNECRQHWRTTKREVPFDLTLHDRGAHDHNPETHLLIEQMLAQLSEDDRELIRLRYIADLPLKDIAEILNLNLITARVRLHRALSRGRSILTSQNL